MATVTSAGCGGRSVRRRVLLVAFALLAVLLLAVANVARVRPTRAQRADDGDDDDDTEDYAEQFGGGDDDDEFDDGGDFDVEDALGGDTDFADLGAEDEADEPAAGDEAAKTPQPTAVIDPAARGGAYAVEGAPTPGEDGVIVAETFQDGEEGVFARWTRSSASEYTGEWAVGGGANASLPGDKGLIVTRKSHRYGIARAAKTGSIREAGGLVVQYEVKHDEGHTCSGAYLKLLAEPFEDLASFDGAVPYSVMFGPDKCGSTNKVHFIFQLRHPKSGKLVEHHLRRPPSVPHTNKKTHLYTLVARPERDEYAILVDNEEVRTGKLKEDFEPPVEPPAEIEDADDKKPDDWVDQKKIPDPDARKPDDWEEDAPRRIPDPDARMPAGWLEDEPEKVPDPEAVKPEAWDDEEDGEWTAPLVPNTECAHAPGCGKWTPPLVDNPAYQGKWTPPLIDNPAYQGKWTPRRMANPEYYEVSQVELLPVAAVGVEIWTVDQGQLFDNVLVATGTEAERVAADFASKTFASKVAAEGARDATAADEGAGDDDDDAHGAAGVSGFQARALRLVEVALEQAELLTDALESALAKLGLDGPTKRVLAVMQSQPMLLAALIPPVAITFFALLFGGRTKQKYAQRANSTVERGDAAAVRKKKNDDDEGDEDEQKQDDDGDEEEDEAEEEEEAEENKRAPRQSVRQRVSRVKASAEEK